MHGDLIPSPGDSCRDPLAKQSGLTGAGVGDRDNLLGSTIHPTATTKKCCPLDTQAVPPPVMALKIGGRGR